MLHDLIQCDCCHQNRSAVSQCVDLHICTDVLGLDEGLDGKIFRKYAQMSVRDFDLEHREGIETGMGSSQQDPGSDSRSTIFLRNSSRKGKGEVCM